MNVNEKLANLYNSKWNGLCKALNENGLVGYEYNPLLLYIKDVLDFENADIKLHYKEPTLKVKINKDGIIEKGTWSYTIKIDVANLHVAAVRLPIEAMVESAYGSVGYVITVGGGF